MTDSPQPALTAKPRHFRNLLDLSSEELHSLLKDAHFLKKVRGTDEHPQTLHGKSVVILLEKASTRTRLSFDVGIYELGGNPLTMIAKDTQLGRGEPLKDTAAMLSGFAHAVVYRTFGHAIIEELAAHSRIPVINGLSDLYHPCQLLADLQTVQEEFGPDLRGLEIAWIGDGNNMAHSWILAAAHCGFHLRIASPAGYQVDPKVVELGRAHGAKLTLTESPSEAVRGAHVVTTDVWASMGQEEEQEERAKAFAAFEVDAKLMSLADAKAIFLHCLPAHRGEEVSAEVVDGPQSRIYSEAENRLHAQKALLRWCLPE